MFVGEITPRENHLPPRIGARILLRQTNRFSAVHLAAQKAREMRHAMSLHHPEIGRQGGVIRQKPPHLFRRALAHHRLETGIDPGMQHCAGRIEKNSPPFARPEQRLAGIVAEPFGVGAASGVKEFDGPQDARRILRVQGCCALRVAGAECCMQILPRRRALPPFHPNRGIDRRRWHQALRQRPEIEPRSTRDHDGTAHRPCLGDEGCRIREIAPHGIFLSGRHETEERVRRACLFLWRGASGKHTEIGIDLHGIRVDDAAAAAFGDCDRQGRLAAGGRTCNQGGECHREFLPCRNRT